MADTTLKAQFWRWHLVISSVWRGFNDGIPVRGCTLKVTGPKTSVGHDFELHSMTAKALLCSVVSWFSEHYYLRIDERQKLLNALEAQAIEKGWGE